jgi:hypothetical protein
VPRRPRLLMACLSLTLLPPLAGCGDGPPDTSMPPLTPEPGLTMDGPADSRPPGDQTPSRSTRVPGFAARVALQRFLRAVGTGSPRACAYVAPAYERTLFGGVSCTAWVSQADLHLTAAQRTTLRAVRVPTGTAGASATEFTVQFTDLRWSGPVPQPGGILRTRFVLRKIGSRWLLAA